MMENPQTESDVTATPKPPVLQVTDPGTVTESSPVAKQKDPKKVAAGKKGAAARSAILERLHEENRATKEVLPGPKDTRHEDRHAPCRRISAIGGGGHRIYESLDNRGGEGGGTGNLGCLTTRASDNSTSSVGTNEDGNTSGVCSTIKDIHRPI